jgi:3-dehydroquinate synthase
LPLKFELHNSEINTEFIANEVLNIMKSDKKNSFGNMNLILPVDIEKVEEINTIEESKILNIIKECHNA